MKTEVIETFQLTLQNHSQGVTFSINESIQGAELESAEWIVEAPSGFNVLPLANFGSVSFFSCAATLNSVTGPINDVNWQYDAITMETTNSIVKAQPTGLTSGGTAFTDYWYHQ